MKRGVPRVPARIPGGRYSSNARRRRARVRRSARLGRSNTGAGYIIV
jgi:hypothetical protein